MIKQMTMDVEENLLLDWAILQSAGLFGHVRLEIHPGEIRIVREEETDPERVLEELAGCLGEESAADYDFDLKYGGLYEAR